jgi:hypothetical protein
MNERMLFALKAGAVVVLFDLVASLLSRRFAIPYTSFRYGSFVIYLLAGLLAARQFGFPTAPVVGGFVGFSEATLGWAISWVIGPGRLPPAQVKTRYVLFAIVMVTVMASLFGALGGVGGLWLSRAQRE